MAALRVSSGAVGPAYPSIGAVGLAFSSIGAVGPAFQPVIGARGAACASEHRGACSPAADAPGPATRPAPVPGESTPPPLKRWGTPLSRFGLAAFWVCLFSGPGLAAEVPAAERIGVTSAAPSGPVEAVLFYLVAGTAAAAAIGVCVSKNIVRMAVWLFAALGAVSLLYFLLAANFLGAIQLIVYVGGTLVLLIFGVMLTSKSPWVRFEPKVIELVGAALVCAALFSALWLVLVRTRWSGPEGAVPGAAVADLGRGLLTTYLVPFEVAGVLLMIVMVGAAHLARQDR
ncbi:MAG: NADH-quinone oxidoreductase subunit J [Planctomycetes bacterium]|nr:NADH-quinone oxidoreductase subunit J [Planctomycetota bacterium]